MRALFFNPADPARPRAGWRLVVFVGVWLFAMLLLMIPATATDYATGGGFLAGVERETDHVAYALIGMAAALIASRLTARYVDLRPVADYGLRFDRTWWRDYGFGLLAGAAQMAFIFGVLLAGDWIVVESVRFTEAVASRSSSAFSSTSRSASARSSSRAARR